MWNKLFKSKSKSSKNLSAVGGGSSGNGSTSTKTTTTTVASPPLDLVPIYNYETDIDVRRNNGQDCRGGNRDSIGVQMCGIPMRKSKFSNAFKSLSLRRGGSKHQLKLYAGAVDVPVGEDEIEISKANKRASLRPSKSDNNLSEKQNYADQEKENVSNYDDHQQYRSQQQSPQQQQQPSQVIDPFLAIPEPPENLQLQQCPICSRNFVPTSLAKHIGICERMQSKKRKPFDSSRQRREGTELASYLPKNFGLPQNHPQTRVSPPKTTNPVRKLSTSKTPTPQRKDYGDGGGMNNLMSTSLTLSSTSTPSGAGSGAAAAAMANSSSTTPRPTLKRSLSQQNEPCPYCERCFGFKAYDRHVEWCREKALLTKNANNSQSISAAKERLQARIQYKAPQIKSKRALNREKYSGSLSCGGSTNSLADLDLPLPRHRSHLNSMSSSISSDNKSDHSGSLKKVSPHQQQLQHLQQFELIATSKQQQTNERKGHTKKREIRANLLENENFMRGNSNSDSNNNNNNHHHQHHSQGNKIFSNNLLIRPTQDVRREKEQAVTVQRVDKLELIGRGDHQQQRVPLKRGATKIVKCNKSDASFFTPTNQPNQAQALAKRSSLSCTATTTSLGDSSDQSSLRTVPSFDTYEEFFYYYEKQDRRRAAKEQFDDYHGGESIQEEEELEIPFTNTIRMPRIRECKSTKHGSKEGGRSDMDEENFVPPFYDSNQLHSLTAGTSGGGGLYGEGPSGTSSGRKKGSRIPKKVARDRSLHRMHELNHQQQEDDGLESFCARDGGSGSGTAGQQPAEMLSRRFRMERVECFDLARDRNEIIQYHNEDSTSEEKQTSTTLHPQQQKEPPQVPRRRHIGEPAHPPSHSTIRNLPSLHGNSVAKPSEPPTPDIKSPKAFDYINNNSSKQTGSLTRDSPSASRLGSERDLMKSVQELDRMCESSSSMYPADSDEMSSVEGYPLSNSSRGDGRSYRGPSAEGSKFSADSAYGSLSRQSPPEQHRNSTIRRAYGHHRGGSKSTAAANSNNNSNAASQQDPFDNSSGSESSLPPITATLKTQKAELHASGRAVGGAPLKNATLQQQQQQLQQMSKFCHECGSRFMIDTAKFCMECGIRRIMID